MMQKKLWILFVLTVSILLATNTMLVFAQEESEAPLDATTVETSIGDEGALETPGVEMGAEAETAQGPEVSEEAGAAEAGEEEYITFSKVDLDTVWVILAGVLVMFMQPGFAMLEAGFCRAKNSVNLIMKNLMDFCFATVAYWAVGFAIMFGAGNALFGASGFFLHDAGGTFDSLSWTSVPLEAKYFFQLVFCGASATIVAGAVAERAKFTAYIIYTPVK